MRITNGMMINNALRDINNNKLNLDRYNTQLSTEKRIQKPSEDPIIAIRALRFRSNLAEIDQYLERNIPDAESWIKVTEDALIGARDMTQSLQEDLVQGANETLGTDERDAIVKNLQAYRDQIFQNANALQHLPARRKPMSHRKMDVMCKIQPDNSRRYIGGPFARRPETTGTQYRVCILQKSCADTDQQRIRTVNIARHMRRQAHQLVHLRA